MRVAVPVMSPCSEPADMVHQVLVGIDDTDNLTTRGTGYHARRLGQNLAAAGLATLLDITRHQLLVDPRIPYTSHNSSLCLRLELPSANGADMREMCRNYLVQNSAIGSDAGLCIAPRDDVTPALEAFGAAAKRKVLTLDDARELAERVGVHLEGLTGDHGGMIGALAAVGLRRSGRDGRVAWRPGIREARGIVTAGDLIAHTGTDAVWRADTREAIDDSDTINVFPWPRSVMIDDRAVLLVEKAGHRYDHFRWQLASKDIISQF
jgi:hypothetical protein